MPHATRSHFLTCPQSFPARIAAASILLLLLCSCSTMLPNGAKQMPLPWANYDQALAAINRIVPYRTTRADLRAMHIDPTTNPSITILTYTDLLARFPAAAAVPAGKLDRGIADCLGAGKQCSGYWISVRQMTTKRVGNFWLDLFAFRQHTITTGWTFRAMILFVGDTAVFALGSGQPHIDNEQYVRNPLGPLQEIGGALLPKGL